jgi:hypothetical protein
MNAETFSWAVEELKKMTYHLMTYVPSLETQVKTLSNTIVDLNTKLHLATTLRVRALQVKSPKCGVC